MKFIYLLFLIVFIACGKKSNEVAVISDVIKPEVQSINSNIGQQKFDIKLNILSNDQTMNVMDTNESSFFLGKYLYRSMKKNIVIDPAMKLKALRSGRILSDSTYNNKIQRDLKIDLKIDQFKDIQLMSNFRIGISSLNKLDQTQFYEVKRSDYSQMDVIFNSNYDKPSIENLDFEMINSGEINGTSSLLFFIEEVAIDQQLQSKKQLNDLNKIILTVITKDSRAEFIIDRDNIRLDEMLKNIDSNTIIDDIGNVRQFSNQYNNEQKWHFFTEQMLQSNSSIFRGDHVVALFINPEELKQLSISKRFEKVNNITIADKEIIFNDVDFNHIDFVFNLKKTTHPTQIREKKETYYYIIVNDRHKNLKERVYCTYYRNYLNGSSQTSTEKHFRYDYNGKSSILTFLPSLFNTYFNEYNEQGNCNNRAAIDMRVYSKPFIYQTNFDLELEYHLLF